nr:hypothetical protein [Verrucomicrobiae bacterium]
FKLAAAIYNLSQLMRKILGFGTPRQLAAAMERAGRPLFSLFALVLLVINDWIDTFTALTHGTGVWRLRFFWPREFFSRRENAICSTGC